MKKEALIEEDKTILDMISEKNFYFCVVDAPITNEKTKASLSLFFTKI